MEQIARNIHPRFVYYEDIHEEVLNQIFETFPSIKNSMENIVPSKNDFEQDDDDEVTVIRKML